MPRRKSDVPAKTHHKASGQARVRIDGKDHYLGSWGSPEADERYKRIVAEFLTTGKPPEPSRPAGTPEPGRSVNEVLLAFWRHAEGYYVKAGEPTGEIHALRDALRPLRELYGSTAAADFGPLKLKALREAMVRKGWCRTLVNARVRRVKLAFKWGVENEIVPPHVHHGLTAVAGLRRGRSEARESSPVLPVPDAAVNAALPHMNRQVAAMVELQAFTGMRPGEVCGLRPCDVDREGEVWTFRPSRHKTQHHGRERVVYLGPRAQAVLSAYIDNRPAESPCFSPAEAEADRLAARHAGRRTPRSCGNRPGTNRRKNPKRRPGDRYDSRSYAQAIRYACVKAGVAPWSPNRLRHSAASAIRKGFGLEAAQVSLGHAAADVTQVYAERDADLARRVAAEIG